MFSVRLWPKLDLVGIYLIYRYNLDGRGEDTDGKIQDYAWDENMDTTVPKTLTKRVVRTVRI